MRWTSVLLSLLCLLPATVSVQSASPSKSAAPSPAGADAERRRFEEIKARHDRGEPVTPEERRFAMQFMATHNQANAASQNQQYAKDHPPHESVGLVPLSELGKGKYQGEEGGLYPGGNNVPPPAHLNAGIALARQIAPLDQEGHPSAEGNIVLLSIGMSNTTQEFSMFQRLAGREHGLNPKLVIVDGAQGGKTARVTADPKAPFYDVVNQRLRAAGISGQQVQAVWLKQANARPTRPFPAEAKALQDDIVATLHNLHDRFANLKIVYFSSRIYAGYAITPLNPEPHAYETAFAVKWTIADQLAGKAELNCDPAKGAVRVPWLAWGPYTWADGLKERKDGLTYTRDDLGPDGTHPSPAGQEKVARQLLKFLKSDPTAKPWFLATAE